MYPPRLLRTAIGMNRRISMAMARVMQMHNVKVIDTVMGPATAMALRTAQIPTMSVQRPVQLMKCKTTWVRTAATWTFSARDTGIVLAMDGARGLPVAQVPLILL